MISNYPYFGLPNYMRYMNPNFYPRQISNTQNINNISYSRSNNKQNTTFNSRANNYKKPDAIRKPSVDSCSSNFKKENSSCKSSNDSNINRDFDSNCTPIFNLLGISIYFDDVLIVCILFFLYTEKVNDPFLFITLVLLLLS